MTLLNPAYRVSVGDQRIDSTSEPLASTLVDLEVFADMAEAAQRCILRVGEVGFLTPELEDDVVVELGYADAEGSLTRVMTGAVEQLDDRVEQRRVVGLGAGATMLRSFKDESVQEVSAGDIVASLAQEAGVSVERTEPGIRFPNYVIDSCRSFYGHCADLARLSGFDLYLNVDNELVFQAFGQGNTIHTLRFEEHVLGFDVQHTVPLAGRVEAWGESPGASAGAESWSWLTKDFDALKGESGTDDPLRLVENSALRTAEAAATAADAEFADITARELRGTVLLLGDPAIKLGDAIRLQGMPRDDLNGTFQVRSVAHRLNKAEGFVTLVGFRPTGVSL